MLVLRCKCRVLVLKCRCRCRLVQAPVARVGAGFKVTCTLVSVLRVPVTVPVLVSVPFLEKPVSVPVPVLANPAIQVPGPVF